MRKHTQQVVIDGFLFVSMLALIGTGIVLEFILPPGSGQQLAVWLTRHEWGSVHFWIAVFFTASVLIHLCLHLKWIITSYFKKKI